MASSAKLQGAFENTAIRFGCSESDFLMLCSENIRCYEDLYFRMPRVEDFEDFLRDVICPKLAWKDENDQIITYERPGADWNVWRRSPDAASLRKLYHLAKQVAAKELERLTLGTAESEKKAKVTLPIASELEEKAVRGGMPIIRSDRERPALATLTKVNANFTEGGEFSYIPWERYFSIEEESRMRPGRKNELRITGEKLTVDMLDEEVAVVKIESALRLQETLQIRARAHHILSLANSSTYNHLTDLYISKLRETVPEGMRVPTIEEIRRVDKSIHNEILKFVAKGHGTLEGGLGYYTSDEGLKEKVWLLASPQLATLPDQGVEKSIPHVSAEKIKDDKWPKKDDVKRREDDNRKKDAPKESGMTLCATCGKTRKEHPKRLFCKPPWQDKDSKGKKGDSKGSGNKRKRG